jgi:hypothetical protein
MMTQGPLTSVGPSPGSAWFCHWQNIWPSSKTPSSSAIPALCQLQPPRFATQSRIAYSPAAKPDLRTMPCTSSNMP